MQKNDSKISVSVVAMFIVILLIVAMAFVTNADSVQQTFWSLVPPVIAIALALEPQLLIADEPTTALDVTIQAQVLQMMSDLQKKLGTSTILITHDLGVVSQTCDRVAVMYAGEIVESGTAEDIFLGETHHPYTTGLFGSLPDLNKETRRLSPIDGLMPDPADLPKGCKFNPRCPHCTDICRSCEPALVEKDGHAIRCHMINKEANA